ncbi:MAG TPA: hypothetical protein VF921_17550, partial [Vicinamibacterales bacterium]
ALQLDSLHDFKITLGDRSIVVKGRIAHCHIGDLKEGVVLYRTACSSSRTPSTPRRRWSTSSRRSRPYSGRRSWSMVR